MPPVFTRQLAERLDSLSELTVKEGTNGTRLEAGVAWIAPGDFHMVVEPSKGSLRLRMHQEARENSCRPAVDTLFRSVAEHCGPHSLAIVLTGMGHDGLRGCEAIHEGGGRVVVQDEASSVVWGMPGIVANSDLADAVLPLDRIAAEITRLIPCTSPLQAPASVHSRED
jgi:two-component system chemotaxis response regulator CheB